MPLHLVILDRGHSPTAIAGVHRIARLVNSAQQAGIHRITVATELDPASVARIESSMPRNGRSRRFEVVRPTDTAEALGEMRGGDHVAFIDTGVIANAEFFSFLRRSHDGTPLPVRIRVPEYRNLFWSIPWEESDMLKGIDLSNVSDHFSRLYPNGQIPEATPPEDSFRDVSSSTRTARAEKWLVKQSIKASDGLVSRYLNRPISTRITRLLLPYSAVLPVHFTALVALGTVAMLALLVWGNPLMLAAGCVLYHFLSVLDGTDGELARVRFQSSDLGARLDTAVDMATNLLFVVGLNIGLIRIYGSQYEMLGQLLVAGSALFIVVMMLLVRFGPGGGSFDILARAVELRIHQYPRLKTLVAAGAKLLKRDFYALFFAVLGVLGLARVIPWFVLLGLALMLAAAILNASFILRSRAEDILPQHILEH